MTAETAESGRAARDAVDEFLARQPSAFRRAELTISEKGADLLSRLGAWGEAYRRFANELGVPCPESLVRVADAQADRFLHFEFRNQCSYVLYPPERAREEWAFINSLVKVNEDYRPYASMLPVFGQDGYNILIDRVGAVHLLPVDHCLDGPVAADFESFLRLVESDPTWDPL